MTKRASGSPEPLPSPSSSPTEEDISRAEYWDHEHDQVQDAGSSTMNLAVSAKRRGKERARDVDVLSADGDAVEEDEDEGEPAGYPPTKEQEQESRKIEENLRRWELNERQRRRAARESVSSLNPTSSIVGDVTRKATMFWSGKRNNARPDGGGQHHVLRSTDDGSLPLQEIDSPAPSPSPRLSRELDAQHAHPQNPFATPSASTTSLNLPQQSPIMSESSNPVDGGHTDTPPAQLEGNTPTSASHLVVPKPRRPGSIPLPPPQPLDLPKPRTPPPRTMTPHANRPPEPIPPPSVAQNDRGIDDVPRPTRWWTDWLCGCIETGDHQAGRTNPFE